MVDGEWWMVDGGWWMVDGRKGVGEMTGDGGKEKSAGREIDGINADRIETYEKGLKTVSRTFLSDSK